MTEGTPMTRTDSLDLRQQIFDKALEDLMAGEKNLDDQLANLMTSTCLSAPEEPSDWGTYTRPARATRKQLAFLSEFALSSDEDVRHDINVYLTDLHSEMPEWVEQLETQARLDDFVASTVQALNDVVKASNAVDNDVVYIVDEDLKDTLETGLDELLSITCLHRLEDGDSVAYLSEHDYELFIDQRFKFELAGISTSENSDYDVFLSHVDEAGFLEAYDEFTTDLEDVDLDDLAYGIDLDGIDYEINFYGSEDDADEASEGHDSNSAELNHKEEV